MDSPRGRSWFRGDVDGLRALAIVLVVGYHAELPYFSGGFVGVDIFFVISGFLISRNLLRESATTHRVALLDFWGRRLRRLVPALALVLLVTLVAGALILPAYEHANLAQQGGAAALYVSNVLFAVESSSYFGADVAASPFLHTWSLGVEEQFYLVWPLLFAAVYATGLARRVQWHQGQRRRVLIGVFSVMLIGSLVWSVSLTRAGSDWAFFGLPSRAWEFAVAGLLAAVPVPALLRSGAARLVLSVAGLAVLATGLALIDDSLAYPGFWALLPVGATVLLITAGETWGGEVAPTPLSSALATRPTQWLGRVSYSWYLWHWPAIVLGVAALPDLDPERVRVAAALISLPVAWLAYRFVETPIRFATPIVRSHARTYGFAAAVTATVVVTAVLVAPDSGPAPIGPLAVADLQAPASATLEERVDRSWEVFMERRDYFCPTERKVTDDGDRYCELGDPAGPTVLLIGDSHTAQWWEPIGAVAAERGVRLLVHQHNGCPPYPVMLSSQKSRDPSLCAGMAAADQRVIDALDPDAVLISAWSGNGANIHEPDMSPVEPAEQARRWERGVRTMLQDLVDRGIAVGVILDAPTLPADPKKCIVEKGAIAPCELSREDANRVAGAFTAGERRVVEDLDLVSLDMTDVVCDAERCHLEIDGTLVYVDTQHFTAAFAASQAPRLTTLMDELVARTG